MVGWFQRKSTGINVTAEAKPRTGLFQQKSSHDYVVLWQGREICRYKNVEDFIQAHIEGLRALDANQAELLESFYQGR